MNLQTVFKTLHAEGLVESPQLAEPLGDTSPWFVRVLLGVCGWVGAFLLLLVVGLMIFESLQAHQSVLIVIGALLAGAGLALGRTNNGALGSQFALALGLAGQMALLIGLGESTQAEPLLMAVFAVLVAAPLFWWHPDGVYRFFCALVVCAAWSVFVTTLGITPHDVGYGRWGRTFDALSMPGAVASTLALLPIALGSTALWLRRRDWLGTPASARLEPLAWASTLALAWHIGFTGWNWFRLSGLMDVQIWTLHIGTALAIGAALMYAGWQLTRAARPTTRASTLGALALIAVLTAPAPGITAGVLLLGLGFHAGSQVLLGAATLFLLGYGSNWYYALSLDLLSKSLVLMGTGLLMLMLAWLLRRLPLQETVDAK